MKKSISPGAIVLVVAIAIIIIGLVFWKGTSGDPNKDVKMDILNANLKQSMPQTPNSK